MGGDIRDMLQRLPSPKQGDGASGFDDLWRRGRRQRRMLQVVAMAGSVIALAATITVIGAVVGWSPQLEVAEQPAGCPVTVPAGSFDPSPPYPDRPARGDEHVWYGTKDLWTMLPTDGDYKRRKSIWWSENFPGGQTEEQPPITVAWERLDQPGVAPIVSERGTNAHTETDGWFMIAGIDPDIPGCWRVTADYKGARLSYVYYLATSGDAPTGVEDVELPDGWRRVEIGRAVFGVPDDWTLETFTEPAHVCQNYAERATVFVLHAGPPGGDHMCNRIGMQAPTLKAMPLSRAPADLLPDPGPAWTDLTTPGGIVGQRSSLNESTAVYRFPGLDLWLQFDGPGPLGSLPDDILATMSEADSAVEPDATASPNAAETEVASGRDQWRPRAISKVIAAQADSALTILSDTCNAELRAEVILESPTSVEVVLWTRGGTVDECGDGIKVSLTTPLGDRSVIDQATGNQVLVSPE